MLRGVGAHVRKAVENSTWLIAERVVTLTVGFFISIWLARYLGPVKFGLLSYSSAFVALFATIPYLGFAGVVVQHLVRERDDWAEIMGTVFGTKLIASVLAVVLANLIAFLVVEEAQSRLLILIISISIIFDVSNASRLAFEARTKLPPFAIVSSAAAITGAFLRVVALVAEAPLWVFGTLITIQAAMAALGRFWIYRQHIDRRLRLRFSADRAHRLFRQSWPLIISAGAAVIYLKIDQFMLGQMLGMEAVGAYAVAVRLSEVWYFIPGAIVASAFPRLVELKKSDGGKYRERIKEGLRYLLWLSLAIALPLSLAAPIVIDFLYGEPYREAGYILAIHVWAGPAVFMGALIEKWFLTEDLLPYLIVRQLLGAVINVGLNLILIPTHGGIGAAIATVVAYTFSYYLSCFTSRKTAPAGRWMTEAILWPIVRPRSVKSSI